MTHMSTISFEQVVFVNLTTRGAFEVASKVREYVAPGWLEAPLSLVFDVYFPQCLPPFSVHPSWLFENGQVHLAWPDGEVLATQIKRETDGFRVVVKAQK